MLLNLFRQPTPHLYLRTRGGYGSTASSGHAKHIFLHFLHVVGDDIFGLKGPLMGAPGAKLAAFCRKFRPGPDGTTHGHQNSQHLKKYAKHLKHMQKM